MENVRIQINQKEELQRLKKQDLIAHQLQSHAHWFRSTPEVASLLNLFANGIINGSNVQSIRDVFYKKIIELSPIEIHSGHDRIKWAEGLIKQLPTYHEGRNSWLLNYGNLDDFSKEKKT